MHTTSQTTFSIRALLLACFLSCLFSALGPLSLRADDTDLANAGYRFLEDYCKRCHGDNQDVPGFIVTDRDILTGDITPTSKKVPYINLDDPKKSLLWTRVVVKKAMPPDYADKQPSDAQREEFGKWILAGAPFPEFKRQPVAEEQVLSAIRNHLQNSALKDQPKLRYLTLTNLHNNPKVSHEHLRLARAAASKLLNGLSWDRDIHRPEIVEANGAQAVLAFTLEDYGWDAATWHMLFKDYPYGVLHGENRRIRQIEYDIERLSGHGQAYIRLDWFVANASKAPLYDKLLELPDTLTELEEEKLDVDFQEQFHNEQLRRGGRIDSGVSKHNRIVDRLRSQFGAYWRSFDFSTSNQRGNIVRFPLGPRFSGNPFSRHAFEEAGGEVIYSLPNGLHGYMLADQDGKRLAGPAPIEIVRDKDELGGSTQVVNGLSCIACHDQGIKKFADDIRANPAVFGGARQKVRDLYATQDEMDELQEDDRRDYLAAAKKATAEFLLVGSDSNKAIEDLPEPIGEVARQYLKDLTIDAAAAELGIVSVDQKRTSADELSRKIDANDRLVEMGLGPLLNRGGLKRELWQNAEYSLFHRVVVEFGKTQFRSR